MRGIIYALLFSHAAVSVSAQAVSSSSACDPGWVSYNMQCYMFSRGRAIQWASARDECAAKNAGLLRVYAQSDIDWVVSQAANRSTMAYWTALNDNPKPVTLKYGTGRWKWGTNEMANNSLIQWNQSPANDGVSNCGGINLQGKAADVICSAKQGYICSVPMSNGGCPIGWMNGDYNCYWVSNTTDPTQLLKWADAKTWCTNKATGAGLLVINNASDVNYLMNQLPYLAKTTKIHWIDLTYNTNTKTWGWDNGAPFYQNLIQWKSEPDNVAGIENCGVIRRSGKFSDRDCSTLSNYICMKPQPFAYTGNNLGCGNWIRAGQQCYGFYTKKRLTWQGARGFCQGNGGDLIKLNTLDKQSWLSQQLLDPTKNRLFWTGLNDIANEGNYVWADGSSVNQTYINWNQEPNNYKGQEDCGLIYATGQYNDMSCTTHAAAICEIQGASQCPDATWKQSGSSCYLFTPYNNVSGLFMQREAASYCSQFVVSATAVGALLSVNNNDEKTFIKSQLAALPDNVYGWWTSLNDRQSEGFWSFGDGTYDPSIIDWSGEPSQKPNDDCGLVLMGAFHERDCTRTIPFICERYAAGFSGSTVTKGSGFFIATLALIALLTR